MIPVGFKLRTQEDMFYFYARNCNQKYGLQVCWKKPLQQ